MTATVSMSARLVAQDLARQLAHWRAAARCFRDAEEFASAEAWKAVEADRKRPWKIAARFGLRPLWLYVTGRLTADGAVSLLGRRVGIDAHAVAARDGLAAVDVDKPQDLADVRRITDNAGESAL